MAEILVVLVALTQVVVADQAIGKPQPVGLVDLVLLLLGLM